MKVTFKTIKNQTFTLEFEPESKIEAVKERLQSEQGDAYPAQHTLLIYQGKVLKNESTLAASKVEETGFMVVMVQKPKGSTAPKASPAIKPSTSAAAPAPKAPVAGTATGEGSTAPATTTPASTTQPTAAAPAPAVGTPEPAATGQPAAGGAGFAGSASTFAVGSQLEQSINSIAEMGFPREEIIVAMRAAYNNPERAVEYLMTGIPAGAGPPPPAPRQANPNPLPASNPTQAAQGTAPASGAPATAAAPAAGQGPNAQPLDLFAPQQQRGGGAQAGSAGDAANRLAFMRTDPQFNALRQVVQNNPGLLQPMLQELARNQPGIMQTISQNQEEFMRLIAEPPPAGAEAGGLDPNILNQLLGGAAGGAEEGGHPGVEVALSQEEVAAIERLEGMGYDRQLVLEAFLACDRDEALAANYLAEHGLDEMEQ